MGNTGGTYDTTSRVSYNGFTTTVTDALNRSIIEVKNVLGQVVQMTDKASGVMSYEYDLIGNLLETTDPAGNKVVLSYDQRGRKTGMNDPDMGVWSSFES